MDTITYRQMRHVATQANKLGGQGKRVIGIIPPQNATDGEYDFIFITDTPRQLATDRDWRV
jgi:uncharacterized protein with GYD domain